MTWLRAACLAAVALLAVWPGFAVYADSQGAIRIANLTVSDLSPLEISFDVQNDGQQGFVGVRGAVVLSESTGSAVDQIAVAAFSLPAGTTVRIRAAGRWELQLAGTYLIDATLDLGAGALVSASLPFRIAPIELPRARALDAGSKILTLVQEPANWGLDRVGARDAWALSHGSPDVVVAVIDSGIDSTIPQLQGSLWVNEDEVAGNGIDDDRNGYIDDVNGWDFRDNDASSLSGTPLHGHGTGVAAILAARPGRYPIVGIAPGIRLMDVRFLDSSNSFRSSDWKTFSRAVDYAVNNGADLINLSIYANGKPPGSFEQTIANARAQGVIVVGISGNQGGEDVMYPGCYESVLAVSSLSPSESLSSFSNRGAEVDVCAPGDGVATFTTGGRVVLQSGTSFAAPHVTGILALMLSVDPTLDPVRAIEILETTAIDLGARGRDGGFGYGLVNAAAAVLTALGR